MALLSLPVPPSSHWGVCSQTPGCKKGTHGVCVHVCTSACFKKMQLTIMFSWHLHPVQAKLQEQGPWDRGCVQNWPILVFSLASLRVKNRDRGSPSSSPLQTKPEPERRGKPMCCAYQSSVHPEMRRDWWEWDMLWLLPFLLPMFSPVALAWPLPGCRSSQHL